MSLMSGHSMLQDAWMSEEERKASMYKWKETWLFADMLVSLLQWKSIAATSVAKEQGVDNKDRQKN